MLRGPVFKNQNYNLIVPNNKDSGSVQKTPHKEISPMLSVPSHRVNRNSFKIKQRSKSPNKSPGNPPTKLNQNNQNPMYSIRPDSYQEFKLDDPSLKFDNSSGGTRINIQ